MKKYTDYKEGSNLTELDYILDVLDPEEEESILSIIETIIEEEKKS